ncbi:MAG TPA: hypothetical protein DGF30_07385, partial [Desulfomicrobium sp.]|nr:hypothetical protein [Desulfomicrobium sp.]
MPEETFFVSEPTSMSPDPQYGSAWRELCAGLNRLHLDEKSWWNAIVEDREAVLRVDDSAVEVRIRGNVLAVIGMGGGEPQCRIEPGHLLLTHPGSRVVLRSVETDARSVRNLTELAEHYDHVRRRACRHSDRRQAILDRLFLRHSCVLAVDAPFSAGLVDLVALSPQGTAVFFLLRRYADGDLRLNGRGGVVWRMREMDSLLADQAAASIWIRGLLERGAALDTRRTRRYRLPGPLHVHPHAR